MSRVCNQKTGEVHTWYSLVVLEGPGFSYLNDEGGDVLEFSTFAEAQEERENQDCPEGICIVKETRELLPD